MKMKSIFPFALCITAALVTLSGCQKGDLVDNPNIASTTSTIPASLVLNHLTATMIRSVEYPFGDAYKFDQYFVANYSYYRGTNTYTFGNTTDSYDILKYAIALEQQSTKQLGNQTNKYYAVAQFFRAYSYIWLSQRVGDIPALQAGDPNNLMPKFDTQHDVYKNSLALLDKANTILGAINATTSAANAALDAGDIFGFSSLQWQKLINTYKLRVLISLSKRAADNADLNVPQQFAAIVGNSTQYPIMTSNSDNMVYKFNASTNGYPTGNGLYDNYGNMCNTYLNITTANQDPRTFATSTPAPSQISAGKSVGDFSAYIGADINVPQGTLLSNSNAGAYSFVNNLRYYSSLSGANAEPFAIISYAEMCFNIAEGINRGWAPGNSAATWYNSGINASLAVFGLTNGQTYTIADLNGKTIGTTVINIPQFLNNVNVVYKGDNNDGLTQILNQKYVAMFNNSGFEAYYQYRRTGIPALSQGGVGIGTPNNTIPRRWLYPATEITYNATNYQAALSSQFGGTDDLFKDTWLTK
jgi:hypothetical protein